MQESMDVMFLIFLPVKHFFKDVIETYGRLDILVNNAGITRDGLLMKMTESDYDAVLQTNLKGTFNGIRFASRQMLRQKSGRIINISRYPVFWEMQGRQTTVRPKQV